MGPNDSVHIPRFSEILKGTSGSVGSATKQSDVSAIVKFGRFIENNFGFAEVATTAFAEAKTAIKDIAAEANLLIQTPFIENLKKETLQKIEEFASNSSNICFLADRNSILMDLHSAQAQAHLEGSKVGSAKFEMFQRLENSVHQLVVDRFVKRYVSDNPSSPGDFTYASPVDASQEVIESLFKLESKNNILMLVVGDQDIRIQKLENSSSAKYLVEELQGAYSETENPKVKVGETVASGVFELSQLSQFLTGDIDLQKVNFSAGLNR